MSMRARLLLVSALGGAIALLSPSSVLAKTDYPLCVQAYFCGPAAISGSERCRCPNMGTMPGAPICMNPMQTQPPCRLCHIQGTTGPGTIQTPFGVSMLAHGLSGDNSSVCTALAALDADHVDSDGDGMTDVYEIASGAGDPNTAANVSWSNEPTPTYGCAIGAGRRWLLATVSTLVGLVVLRRRRRRA
jgi:hypothetical protein